MRGVLLYFSEYATTQELTAVCFSQNVDRYKVCNIEQQLTSLYVLLLGGLFENRYAPSRFCTHIPPSAELRSA